MSRAADSKLAMKHDTAEPPKNARRSGRGKKYLQHDTVASMAHVSMGVDVVSSELVNHVIWADPRLLYKVLGIS